MGHTHSHALDEHAPEHFERCDHPSTCFCEVNRYFLATMCGLLVAFVQWWFVRNYAGSYGAEGDASHTTADSLFMFVSVFLALWKHFDKKKQLTAEKMGIVLNTAFLVIAAMFIYYRAFFSDEFTTLSGGAMFIAGMIGLVGNIGQYIVLGHAYKDEVSLHSTTIQHVVYDIVYSVMVIGGSIFVSLVSGEYARHIDRGIAFLLATLMLYSCMKNLRGLRNTHAHHAHHH